MFIQRLYNLFYSQLGAPLEDDWCVLVKAKAVYSK